MVADINPGSARSSPKYFAVFNNKLYFGANDGTNGNELWAYDGLSTPSMVANINP
jgi:ELWxxDGT repeat protein